MGSPVFPVAPVSIAPRLLAWFDQHGRKHLAWQLAPTPYRVWVSEVMLQQTQVATVAPYYERFMSSFPSLATLAAAELDEVLHVWTGLGYYARARNLHRAARIVVEDHGGCVPEDIGALQRLPGIGRSTAGAILALSRSQRHAILDGNARRVIARYFGVEGHSGEPKTLRQLWGLAEACTPLEDVAAYTQAIMDLGSGVCTRTRPGCEACPLGEDCVARATGRQLELPARRPRRRRGQRESVALIVVRPDGAILLEERPPRGLWGGLASLPMFDAESEARDWCTSRFGIRLREETLPPYEHAFTHFDLTLRPLIVDIEATTGLLKGYLWFDPARPPRVGLSKPAVDLMRAAAKDQQARREER